MNNIVRFFRDTKAQALWLSDRAMSRKVVRALGFVAGYAFVMAGFITGHEAIVYVGFAIMLVAGVLVTLVRR